MLIVVERSSQAQKRFQKRINHRPPARVESANGRRDRLRNKKVFDQEHRAQKTGAPVSAPPPQANEALNDALAAKLRAYREAEERRRDKKAEALERRKRKPRYYL